MKKIPLLILSILIPLSARAGKDDVRLDVKTHTFANGLELLVVERHFSPTFSAIVWAAFLTCWAFCEAASLL